MHKTDLDRVEFFSKEDMSAEYQLLKAETTLRNTIKSDYEDINDVLELYNIKLYIDNKLSLKSWSLEDIALFEQKVSGYSKVVEQFMSNINDNNVVKYYEELFYGYINSFWEIVNNQKIYKQISSNNLASILLKEPNIIQSILIHRKLVEHHHDAIRNFLLNYSQSTEILLSIYEVKNDFNHKEIFLPKSLTIQDKEDIISEYLDSENVNLNYLRLIQNSKKGSDFKISDKIRLKAKRRCTEETDKINKREGESFMKYGALISFPENPKKIKEGHLDNMVANYSYSLDFIKQYNDDYSLFLNFKILFDYTDNQNRINLVSKTNQMGILERIMGVHSKNEYRHGAVFNMFEMASQAQIFAYNKIINEFGNSIENILKLVFTSIFHKKYDFANNARLSMSSANTSFFEKVRLLAPEFESVLKQYKLFVEEGEIDFELLQISSVPCTIKDIPSLVQNKYIYLNEGNDETIRCLDLFFSDQMGLAYVEPFKEKYQTLCDLLNNEQVNFNNFKEYQKPQINYLLEKGLLTLDNHNNIQIANILRVSILKDLYDNEVASFYYYPIAFQDEVKKMYIQKMVFFGETLFSKSEQSYFNYFLNKREFTNGLDMRNSYLHGTQANPEEIQEHEYAYYSYLKLLTLILLKIEDDLLISQMIEKVGD